MWLLALATAGLSPAEHISFIGHTTVREVFPHTALREQSSGKLPFICRHSYRQVSRTLHLALLALPGNRHVRPLFV